MRSAQRDTCAASQAGCTGGLLTCVLCAAQGGRGGRRGRGCSAACRVHAGRQAVGRPGQAGRCPPASPPADQQALLQTSKPCRPASSAHQQALPTSKLCRGAAGPPGCSVWRARTHANAVVHKCRTLTRQSTPPKRPPTSLDSQPIMRVHLHACGSWGMQGPDISEAWVRHAAAQI